MDPGNHVEATIPIELSTQSSPVCEMCWLCLESLIVLRCVAGSAAWERPEPPPLGSLDTATWEVAVLVPFAEAANRGPTSSIGATSIRM